MKTFPKPWRFKPNNPQKYRGDINKIIMRSSWEGQFALYCDTNAKVKTWGSEIKAIPYVCSLDGRNHRYFPDFWVNVIDEQNKDRFYMIEIKPKRQVNPPRNKSKITEQRIWSKNRDKWNAATAWCQANPPWEFKILTENELFRKNTNKTRKRKVKK